jgi:phospho-N-acetylmuramoyl-pentapeptide-transferase
MKTYLLPLLAAFTLTALLLYILIPLLKRLKFGQEILSYVTEHNSKRGTPTMGGIAFVLAIVAVTLLFCGTSNRPLLVALVVMVSYAIVGFLDDFLKIKRKQNEGLKAYQKIIFQLAIAVAVAIYVYGESTIGDKISLPFSDRYANFGWLVVPFVIFIYLAVTNGVNLTDGLDGLATTTTLCYMLGMFALLVVEMDNLESVGDTLGYQQTQQILVLIAVAIGALFAFYLFNCFPARVFMGDVGSLSLGALVACVSIFTRMSIYIPILGIMYVVSCLSVIIQVGYFKISGGKRVFLMAPFHHHLQKRGYSETRVAALYSAVTLVTTVILLIFGG